MALCDYSDDELRRLSTLTCQTTKPGEFVGEEGFKSTAALKTETNTLVHASGSVCKPNLCFNTPVRVRDFGGVPIDPTRDEMRAELARREEARKPKRKLDADKTPAFSLAASKAGVDIGARILGEYAYNGVYLGCLQNPRIVRDSFGVLVLIWD